MKTSRKKTRKLLLQELFSMIFIKFEESDFLKNFFQGVYSFEIDQKYLQDMKKNIIKYEYFFIFIIKKYLPRFDIHMMSGVNLLIIYICLAEIFYLDEEIPFLSSINEAIELSKIYSDESSKKMINGFLDNTYKNYLELEKLKFDKTLSKEKYSIFLKF